MPNMLGWGSYDINIDLKPGAKVWWGPIYSLTELELRELCKYLDENLAHGFIRPSQFPGGALIIFVKKKDGSLRLCVDYRNLNVVTVKNRYPLPLFSDMLCHMQGAKIYTRINICNAYNLIHIAAGDEWKTASFSMTGDKSETWNTGWILDKLSGSSKRYANIPIRSKTLNGPKRL